MNKYIIEFIGTFFLVLVIALTGNSLAIGAILIAMIYMGGYISGAHYNPAVTVAVLLRKAIGLTTAIGYIVAQILGGVAAAGLYLWIQGSPFVPQPAPQVEFMAALVIEVFFTFALASVVLHVATSPKTKDNQYYGLAIGLTVMAAAIAGGPISGGVYNPAVAVGPLFVDYRDLSQHTTEFLLYTIGPLMGGVTAAIVYKLTTLEKT